MKYLWANDPEKIKAELQYIISNKISMIFVCQNAKAVKITAKGFFANAKESDLLVLSFPGNFPDLAIQCICYYHLPATPMRSFQCVPVKKTGAYLVVKIPAKIFEIQRRKFPRVKPPQQSVATFSLRNKQRVLSGRIKDISLEGARITGNFPTVILKNDIVTPVSLSLFKKFKNQDETLIQIPEATVARSTGDDETTSELALHFQLPPEKLQRLDEYVQSRQREENFQ